MPETSSEAPASGTAPAGILPAGAETVAAPDDAEQADAALIQRAAAGDQTAFRALYRRHVRPVYWIAHGIVGTAADAEDVTQETFLVAWRRLPELDLVGASMLPWLATICRFQAANRLRRQRRERAHTAGSPDEDLPDGTDVLQQVITADLAVRIETALTGLSDLDREIFRLCAVEGYDYRSAADALDIPHGAVRNRLSRARTHLRGALTETEDS